MGHGRSLCFRFKCSMKPTQVLERPLCSPLREEIGGTEWVSGNTHWKIVAILQGRDDEGLDQGGSNADWGDRQERHFGSDLEE